MARLLLARPRVVVALACLAIGAGLALGLSRQALAHYSFTCSLVGCGGQFNEHTIDWDRYVPEMYGAPEKGHYDGVAAEANRYYDFHYHRWIDYDGVEMDRHCATQWEWNALVNHERAHTRGWSHWEAPRSSNPAYKNTVYLGGC